MRDNPHHIILIVNPIAGRGKARRMLYRIVNTLCHAGYIVTTFITTRAGEAVDVARRAAKYAERIVCCGGDGTLNEVITGLTESGCKIPVGYIPTGTTNDLAKALRLPLDVNGALRVIEEGTHVAHDVGRFNDDKCFTYVASFGAFTRVSYGTPQWLKNLIGRKAYILSGIASVFDIRGRNVTITADGHTFSGRYAFGSVSNSTVVGGIIQYARDCMRFDDGLFELLLIRMPRSIVDLLHIGYGILRGRYDAPYFTHTTASNVTLRFDKPTSFTVDGEYGGRHKSVRIGCMRRAAHIIVPKPHPHPKPNA